MIEVSKLTKSFDDIEIIKDFDLRVDSGERISILGPGGSGKTTLLKLILGLLPPDTGNIKLLGQNLWERSERERLHILKKVGMAFQQGGLFDFMTVTENLKFAMEHMTDLSEQAMDARVDELLAAVKLLRTKAMYPYELSGGMQRRVGIARALCTDPQCAIFDEPTSGLDPVTSTIILNMIKALGAKNPAAALVVCTSSVEIAIRFAERIVIINKGAVEAEGDWRDLIVNGSPWVKHFLGVRLIGIDLEYAQELGLPPAFIKEHWH